MVDSVRTPRTYIRFRGVYCYEFKLSIYLEQRDGNYNELPKRYELEIPEYMIFKAE